MQIRVGFWSRTKEVVSRINCIRKCRCATMSQYIRNIRMAKQNIIKRYNRKMGYCCVGHFPFRQNYEILCRFYYFGCISQVYGLNHKWVFVFMICISTICVCLSFNSYLISRKRTKYYNI